MPEMPEVRTVSMDMDKLIKNKVINDIKVLNHKIIHESTVKEFENFLKGETINKVSNIGKWIITDLTNNKVYVSHLRMTGRYNMYNVPTPPSKHTHIIFNFTDGTQLHFDDPRRFATAHIRTKAELLKVKPLSILGPEPSIEQVDYFYNKIHKSGRAIKTLILDQSIILGYGNIYVDETLWKESIHPLTKGSQVTKQQAERILLTGEKIMNHSTELGGSSISTYGSVNGKPGRYAEHIQVFRKNGKPCPKCKTIIEKIKVNGRGTHFCPKCQKILV